MEEYKCFVCGSILIDNPDYKKDNGQPLMICSDEECDKTNRMVL